MLLTAWKQTLGLAGLGIFLLFLGLFGRHYWTLRRDLDLSQAQVLLQSRNLQALRLQIQLNRQVLAQREEAYAAAKTRLAGQRAAVEILAEQPDMAAWLDQPLPAALCELLGQDQGFEGRGQANFAAAAPGTFAGDSPSGLGGQ